MKSTTLSLLALFLLITTTSVAQSKENIFFDKETQIVKFHTIDELEEFKKGQLIQLYVERINEIITILPFIALSNEPSISLADIGIKENSDNLKVLDKHHKSTIEAFQSTNEMITEFIPYADTEKIIWSILYFEEVIKKIRIGMNSNF